jgi:DNA polymerase III epsilon subunit-like protein
MHADKLLLLFDTETTGLPRFERGYGRGFPDPMAKTANYNGCRVVSLAWMVVRQADHVVLREASGLVRPEGFAIPAEAQAVHGISTAHALAAGEPFDAVAARFVADLRECGAVGGHNVDFDVHVLGAEFARRGRAREREGPCNAYTSFALPALIGLPRVCTMALGKRHLGQARNPKLSVLYETIFGRPLDGAHDAFVDTLACYRCLTRMAPAPAEFVPGPWTFTLREVQSAGAASSAEAAPSDPAAPSAEAAPSDPAAPSAEAAPSDPSAPSAEAAPSDPAAPSACPTTDADAAALAAMGYASDPVPEPEPEPDPAPETPSPYGGNCHDCRSEYPSGPLGVPQPIEISARAWTGPMAPQSVGATIKSAVVECRTLAEVAAVYRGAIGFVREHYPGRAVRTAHAVLRRGDVEFPIVA